MAQDSSTQSSRRKRRTALIMLALLALVAVAAAVASHWILQTSQKRLLRDMEQDMSTQAGNKVALLTVWSGMLKGQVEAFTGLDPAAPVRGRGGRLQDPGGKIAGTGPAAGT